MDAGLPPRGGMWADRRSCAREAGARDVLAEEGNGVADAGLTPRGGKRVEQRYYAREAAARAVLSEESSGAVDAGLPPLAKYLHGRRVFLPSFDVMFCNGQRRLSFRIDQGR
ncbi:MAG: hypothetical protein IJB41_08025 [Clostridia bacterium]|nr:hypothetical protein [Clostridia bacterium]